MTMPASTVPPVREIPPFWMTTFPAPSRWTTQGKFESWPWVDVLHHVRTPELWPGAESIEASEAQLPGWSFARYADDCRVASEDAEIAARETAARVQAVHGIIVEYVDDPAVDPEHIRQWWGRWQYVAYTTAFHQRRHGEKPPGPRWRVMIPFSRAATLDEAIRVGEWARSPHRDSGIVDPSTCEAWRFVVVPSIVPGGFKFDVNQGEFLDPGAALADVLKWQAQDRADAARLELKRSAIGEIGRHWLAGLARVAAPMASWPGAPGSAEAPHKAALSPSPEGPPAWPRFIAGVGGLWPGRLVAILGPQGSGRTAFVVQVAEAAARQGNPVLLAAMMVGVDEVLARLLAVRAGAPVAHGDLVARAASSVDLELAVRRLTSECPTLYVWSRPHGERTPEALETVAHAMAQAHGGRAPVVVVDGIDGPDTSARWWDVLLDVARPGGLDPEWPGAAVFVVCPLPRTASEPFSTPRALLEWAERAKYRATALEDLDGSIGMIADRAGLVLGLTVDPDGDPLVRDAAIAVLANRHGPRGAFPFRFHPLRGLWEELPP